MDNGLEMIGYPISHKEGWGFFVLSLGEASQEGVGTEMLTEEEKAHIIEKVNFENEIKKELSPPEEQKRYGWIESKIGLLVIGALITGIFVPTFQYTQKLWEWKRQNQFANLTFRLSVMRDCLREFIYLSAFAPEAYERIKPLLEERKLTVEEYKNFERQFVDLQNRRFVQNAKVISLMGYFEDLRDFQKIFEEEYLNAFNLYMRYVAESITVAGCSSGLPQCGQKKKVEVSLEEQKQRLNTKLVELKGLHLRVVAKMKEEIGRAENEGKKFGL